jgi:hypothetical protein
MKADKNWRTTTLGVIAIVTAVLGFVRAVLDADASTEPDMAALTAAIAAGIGLIFAKDGKAQPPQAGD